MSSPRDSTVRWMLIHRMRAVMTLNPEPSGAELKDWPWGRAGWEVSVTSAHFWRVMHKLLEAPGCRNTTGRWKFPGGKFTCNQRRTGSSVL